MRAWNFSWDQLPGKPAGMAPQVQTDWNAVSGIGQLLNKPTFAAVATTGAYSSLTGTPTLATVATTGAYADLSGKPTIPTIVPPTQSQPSRTLNTIFQLSTTRAAMVSYSVQITVTATIAGGQNGDVILEIASDAGFTTNVQTVAIAGNGQVYTLAIALQGVQPTTNVLSGFVPIGYYVRLRTVNNTGTPGYSIRAQQEALL